MAFDFKKYCLPCESWCCKGENPYASRDELKLLGVDKIGTNPDDTCVFLDGGQCSIYSKRPFECRIFPFDVQKINGRLTWVLWDVCPAKAFLNIDDFLILFESIILEDKGIEYLHDYIDYHKKHEPIKYSELSYKIIQLVKSKDDK